MKIVPNLTEFLPKSRRHGDLQPKKSQIGFDFSKEERKQLSNIFGHCIVFERFL